MHEHNPWRLASAAHQTRCLPSLAFAITRPFSAAAFVSACAAALRALLSASALASYWARCSAVCSCDGTRVSLGPCGFTGLEGASRFGSGCRCGALAIALAPPTPMVRLWTSLD